MHATHASAQCNNHHHGRAYPVFQSLFIKCITVFPGQSRVSFLDSISSAYIYFSLFLCNGAIMWPIACRPVHCKFKSRPVLCYEVLMLQKYNKDCLVQQAQNVRQLFIYLSCIAVFLRIDQSGTKSG